MDFSIAERTQRNCMEGRSLYQQLNTAGRNSCRPFYGKPYTLNATGVEDDPCFATLDMIEILITSP